MAEPMIGGGRSSGVDFRRAATGSASREGHRPGTVVGVTEQLAHPEVDESPDHVIEDALAVIDQALGKMMGRELVSSGEVADLLLDVRTLLTAVPAETV